MSVLKMPPLPVYEWDNPPANVFAWIVKTAPVVRQQRQCAEMEARWLTRQAMRMGFKPIQQP